MTSDQQLLLQASERLEHVANFGPVFLLWAVHSRTSYIYYMEPVIPGFACALALVSEAVPRSIQWAFAAMVLYAFFFSFPFQYVF